MLFLLLLTFVALSIGLVWFLLSHDHGEKEPIAALWMAAGLGVLGAGVAAWLEGRLIPVNHLLPGAALGTLLGSSLAVGLIEESCKFLPLAFLIYRRRYFNEYTDGVIYFALAGLGFGLPENILYTLQFGAKTGLVRLFLTPLFHAGITGMVGYYLAKRKMGRQSPWGVAGPLAMAIILHGLYDFGLASGVAVYQLLAVLITLSVSAGLFVLFQRAIDMDQDRGLAVVGHNNFCRACGWANPHHHLYCTHCGQHA